MKQHLKRKSKKKRVGRSLELLVSTIERSLAGKTNLNIKSPGYLPDAQTGEPREHDVVIRASFSHHELVIAIECRDRSRKITVPEVEGFYAKCIHTGVHKAVMVSRLGFAHTAREKATKLGIKCIALESAESFTWLETPGVEVRNRRVVSVNWAFDSLPPMVEKPSNFEIVDFELKPIDTKLLIAAANSEFLKLMAESKEPQNGTIAIQFPAPGLLIHNKDTGSKFPVAVAVAEIKFETEVTHVPFQLVKYADQVANQNLTDTAIAQVNLGSATGRLVISHRPEYGGMVSFIPDAHSDA